ncbi:hypothetical protein A2973_03625 [Candidatus Gottesmanbacteria bacterium RIFCSPLOWO2_01_FULL_49_10]|uniref:N-acetyltransferase domain-containing protein n=1 Tax=Candidatus Gottesmanbacteria bacterium RIFCSPLOWO2_01_FULL_49_10 TaxID=1798396 RepID=A0A1F6AWX5_9BACT|nr:MAG: hypothetical protein A2973_03625 [Candidatus Gottesmanbacteria bacterium RIFCSPLOWO2_01_FULL_49_10]
MKVHIYVSLPDELKAQVDAIHKESFSWASNQTPQERMVGKDKFCSGDDRIGYVVVEEGNDVIGVVALLRRSILFENMTITLGGIGGLCTRKDKRNKGVGTLLLQKAMEELQRARCDIVYLCTDMTKEWMVKFYEKAGFIRIKRGHTYAGKSGKRYRETDGMIAPVRSVEKFQHIAASEKVLDIGRGNW